MSSSPHTSASVDVPAHWTSANISSQSGKRALVTGSNGGIGYHIAMELARAGAAVTLACRDMQKAEAATDKIRAAVPKAALDVVKLDLSSLDSVRQAADAIEQDGRPLDLLINNAGVMAVPTRRLTKDGFELQFGTNHLGHFALTGRLLPLVMKSEQARIVTVSSIAHKSGRFDVANLQGETRYKDVPAYNNSKLANLMFAKELDRRLRAIGSSVKSIGAHPGVAKTNLFSAGSRLDKQPLFSWLTEMFVPILGQSEAAGAWPILYAATANGVEGGDYYGPSGLAEFRGYPKHAPVSKIGQDAAAAKKLWEVSEALSGVTFGALDRQSVGVA